MKKHFIKLNKPPEQSSAPWMNIAKQEIGQKEIPGSDANPRIIEYHSTTGKFNSDEVPWCSSFVNWAIENAGYKGTKSASALSWIKWGKKIDKPVYGSIAVINWGSGRGHVGFVAGKKGNNFIVLLGGNQSDQVKYSTFKISDISSYRIPTNYSIPKSDYNLKEIDIKKENQSISTTR